jgi:very-short-patch-repair endonuclease
MPYDKRARDTARKLRETQTPAETKLWRLLRDRRFHEFKFRRQYPLGPYVADFYCAKIRIIVELDGDSHATRKPYDRERDEWISAQDIRVLRYYNSDVHENIFEVMEAILKACRERSTELSRTWKRRPGVEHSPLVRKSQPSVAKCPSPPTPLPGVPGRGE